MWTKPSIEKSREDTRDGSRAAKGSSLRTVVSGDSEKGLQKRSRKTPKGSFALDDFVGVNPATVSGRDERSGKGVCLFLFF